MPVEDLYGEGARNTILAQIHGSGPTLLMAALSSVAVTLCSCGTNFRDGQRATPNSSMRIAAGGQQARSIFDCESATAVRRKDGYNERRSDIRYRSP